MLPSRSTRYALGAIMLWATQALVLAKELPHLNISIFLTISFFFSGITLTIAGVYQKLWVPRSIDSRSKYSHLRNILGLVRLRNIILGAVGFFLYYFFLFYAIDIGPVITANLCNFLWPLLFVVFAERFFPAGNTDGYGEKTKVYSKLFVGFIGCFLIITGGKFSEAIRIDSIRGPVIGIFAAFVWAAFSIFIKKHQGETEDKQTICWTCYAFGATFISLTLLFFSENATFFDVNEWRKAIVPALYFGIGPLGLAMTLYDKAVRSTFAEKLGRLTFLTPLLSTILLISFTNTQELNRWICFGALLIVIDNMKWRETWKATYNYAKKRAPSLTERLEDKWHNIQSFVRKNKKLAPQTDDLSGNNNRISDVRDIRHEQLELSTSTDSTGNDNGFRKIELPDVETAHALKAHT